MKAEVVECPEHASAPGLREGHLAGRGYLFVDTLGGKLEAQEDLRQEFGELTGEDVVARWQDDGEQRALAKAEHEPSRPDVEKVGVPVSEEARGGRWRLNQTKAEALDDALGAAEHEQNVLPNPSSTRPNGSRLSCRAP